MEVECDLTMSFAANGNCLAFLGGGWALSEAEFTWSVGAESHLALPPCQPDEYLLTLDVIPFIHGAELPSQRLIVSVNETAIGCAELSRPTLLGYRIPAGIVRPSERMLITLQHPDAVRPKDFGDSADDRFLAFAVLEAKLYRVLDANRPNDHHLPVGLMLGSTTERSFGARGHADPTEWATARTGLTIPQIALKRVCANACALERLERSAAEAMAAWARQEEAC
jgi:hypothetical protein